MQNSQLGNQRAALGAAWVAFGLVALAFFFSPKTFAIPKADELIGSQQFLHEWWHQLGQIGLMVFRPVEAAFAPKSATIEAMKPGMSFAFATVWVLSGALTVADWKPALIVGLLLSYLSIIGALMESYGFLALVIVLAVMQAHRVLWFRPRQRSALDTPDPAA